MTNQCEVCGSADTVHGKMALTRTYKGDTISVDVTATRCNACGEVVMDKENSAIYSEALKLQRERVNAELSGDIPDGLSALFKSARRKLGLSQAAAADFFGGGANAFSRYERGQAKPPKALVHLFALLDKFPELIAYLNAQQPGAPVKQAEVVAKLHAQANAAGWAALPLGGTCDTGLGECAAAVGELSIFDPIDTNTMEHLVDHFDRKEWLRNGLIRDVSHLVQSKWGVVPSPAIDLPYSYPSSKEALLVAKSFSKKQRLNPVVIHGPVPDLLVRDILKQRDHGQGANVTLVKSAKISSGEPVSINLSSREIEPS